MGARSGVGVSQFAEGNRAVSKVVGVLLLTGIAIALAATVAGMVTGFAGLLSDPAPQASFSFEYDDDVEDAQNVYHPDVHEETDEVVAVTHAGGEQFDPANVEIVIRWTHEDSEDTGEWRDTWANAATGQTSTVRITGAMYAHVWGDATFDGGSVQVIWNDPDRDSGVLLAEWNGSKKDT